jgi:hypothetical protein
VRWHADANSYAYGDSNANVNNYPYRDSNGYSNSHADNYTNTYSDTVGHHKAYSDTKASPNLAAASDSRAASVDLGDEPDGNCRRGDSTP